MRFQTKVVLISFAVTAIGSLLLTLGDGPGSMNDYLTAFGIIAILGGLLQLVVGLFLLLMTDKKYAQGFLLSGGILILLGFVTCSTVTFSVH